MTGDIVERLEAWAHDTEQSWESIKPLEERGGCEYWRSDKRDIDMVREAADAIRRLKEELVTISDRLKLAEAGLREAMAELHIMRERDDGANARHDSMVNTIASMVLRQRDTERERDEARRLLCRLAVRDGEARARQYAEDRGWNCFREAT